MAHYRSVGEVPPKRHTQHRDPDGKLYREELMGEEGFSSDSSLLYHRGVPSAIVGSEIWELPDQTRTPNHPLKPRHLKLHELATDKDAVTGRRLVLGNNDVRIGYVVTGVDPSPYYRNAIGDECVYVEAGSGTVETVLGVLSYRAGDYVVVPRATTHRWVPSEPSQLYAIEANSHVAPPKRYLSRYGQLLEHAPYCERDLHGPTETFLQEGEDVEVLVKHRTSAGVVGTRMTYATHPFDVVGWDGCLYPYTFNIDDYMPITGKVHQPPPVHQVFEGHNFVVCNFLPRKVDYHELSIPVPYYHSNVDSDEVMFYVGGDYEARKGSGIGLGLDLAAPGRLRARPAAERDRGLARRRLLRGVGGHGRHLRPARPGRGWPRGRGPGVRLDLGRPRSRRWRQPRGLLQQLATKGRDQPDRGGHEHAGPQHAAVGPVVRRRCRGRSGAGSRTGAPAPGTWHRRPRRCRRGWPGRPRRGRAGVRGGDDGDRRRESLPGDRRGVADVGVPREYHGHDPPAQQEGHPQAAGRGPPGQPSRQGVDHGRGRLVVRERRHPGQQPDRQTLERPHAVRPLLDGAEQPVEQYGCRRPAAARAPPWPRA